MALHKESAAKDATRGLILDACRQLGRTELTYLGMPAEAALDILTLRHLLRNVICIADKAQILDETRRNIAALRLKERRFVTDDVWHYLSVEYPKEQLLADVTFLDFYGGGITTDDPFAVEISGLRNYFAKHAKNVGKAFVFAWTYMPRDKGTQKYISALEKILQASEMSMLKNTTGVTFRSTAIRLLLLQEAREHGLLVKLFQHAVYKRVMNTIVTVFSKGDDPKCTLQLEKPESLLTEPCCVYVPGQPAPKLVSLLDV